MVNISSMAGLGGNAGQANYASAKAGIIGLTRTLAKEWGRYNVTVNTVAFGLIKTRLTAGPRRRRRHHRRAGPGNQGRRQPGTCSPRWNR